MKKKAEREQSFVPPPEVEHHKVKKKAATQGTCIAAFYPFHGPKRCILCVTFVLVCLHCCLLLSFGSQSPRTTTLILKCSRERLQSHGNRKRKLKLLQANIDTLHTSLYYCSRSVVCTICSCQLLVLHCFLF